MGQQNKRKKDSSACLQKSPLEQKILSPEHRAVVPFRLSRLSLYRQDWPVYSRSF